MPGVLEKALPTKGGVLVLVILPSLGDKIDGCKMAPVEAPPRSMTSIDIS
jgi:hypothetical protein